MQDVGLRLADNDKISRKGHRTAPRCCRCPFYVICYSVYCRMTKNTRPPMELNLHGERAFCVFVRFRWIYSACGFRLTHGLAPQQTDAEPVHCFIATDSWSMPLSSSFIVAQKLVSANRRFSNLTAYYKQYPNLLSISQKFHLILRKNAY